MCSENINFLKVMLGNTKYIALYDTGATVSLINVEIATKFRDRIKTNETIVKSAISTGYNCIENEKSIEQ